MIGMITINLLPAEMRRAERTPLSRFVVLLVGIGILVSMTAFFFYFRFSVLKFAEGDLQTRLTEQELIKKRHQEYTDLLKLKSRYEQRSQTIEKIRTGRIRWGIKLMQFYDFFAMDSFREQAWIDGLTIDIRETASRGGARGAKVGPQPIGQFEFTVNTKGTEILAITDFREMISGTLSDASPTDLVAGQAFWADFLFMNDIDRKLMHDSSTDPEDYYAEKMSLAIKPREEPAKGKK